MHSDAGTRWKVIVYAPEVDQGAGTETERDKKNIILVLLLILEIEMMRLGVK